MSYNTVPSCLRRGAVRQIGSPGAPSGTLTHGARLGGVLFASGAAAMIAMGSRTVRICCTEWHGSAWRARIGCHGPWCNALVGVLMLQHAVDWIVVCFRPVDELEEYVAMRNGHRKLSDPKV